jgi:DNA polymerase-3 subunit gamma/tau
VDDVREIIEAVRYAAVSARYKVYIVDEVHMLSKNAFNALLKTLEEPPAHVKFLFATTEVNKVPVTVLSRCQRFDLRRISAEQLAQHFAKVCEAEQVGIEPEALALIARAAEGSARDGLSILDQAIAHGEEGVTATQVRAMLGLSDRGAIRNLLGLLLAGDAQAALAAVREQHDLGVEPAALIRGLLESVHGITRAKVGGAQDPAQSVEEREAYAEWAGRLSHAVIHRLWQLLLKGLGEVNTAPLPLEAAEMALLRVIHASELPDPGALLDRLQSGAPLPAPASPAPVVPPQDTLGALPASFADLVNYLSANGKAHIAQQLHDYVRLVRYAPPELAIQLGRPLSGDFVRDLSTALKSATGTQWEVEVAEGESEPSLLDQEKAGAERLRQSVLEQPVVAAAFQAFPDAELTGYRLDEPRSS